MAVSQKKHNHRQISEALPEPDFGKLVAEASAEFHLTHDPDTVLQRFMDRRKKAKENAQTKPAR